MKSPGSRGMLLAGALLCGCADSPATPAITVVSTDSAGVSVVSIGGSVDELPVWRLTAEPLAVVSGEAPPYLGSIGELAMLSDGRLVVEDDQAATLHLFDPTGSHLAVLGGRGDGPGEFQGVTTLSVAEGDTVWAYDRRHYRLSALHPDGELVRSLPIGRELAGATTLALFAWRAEPGVIVVHSLGPGDNSRPSGPAHRDQRDAIIHSLNDSLGLWSEPVRFTGGYSVRGEFGDASTFFANEPFVSVAPGRVLHGSGITYELVLSTTRMAPTRIIRWEGWEEPLTQPVLEAARDTVWLGLQSLRESRPDLAASLIESLFSADVLPDTLPALDRAFLDDRGRIWVSRFRVLPGRWNEQDAWHVLDSLGNPVARVPLPADSRLAGVRGDRIALVTRDTLDVESIEVFGLQDGVPR